jgi:hypothetical protein
MKKIMRIPFTYLFVDLFQYWGLKHLRAWSLVGRCSTTWATQPPVRIPFRLKVRTPIYLLSELVNQNYFGLPIITYIKNLLDLLINGRYIQQTGLLIKFFRNLSMWMS